MDQEKRDTAQELCPQEVAEGSQRLWQRLRQKRVSLWKAVLLCLLTAALAALGVVQGFRSWAGPEGLSMLRAAALIREDFVGDYDPEKLLDDTMQGMIASLEDRWSYYLNPRQYASMQESRANAYVGIGVTISGECGDAMEILAVTPDGPAARAGLVHGDAIVAVEGERVTRENCAELYGRISGPAGSQIRLTVRRVSGTEEEMTLTRDLIHTVSVTGSLEAEKVGYVSMRNFFEGSADSFAETVKSLQNQGAERLIFDVRDNPGGYVEELTKMLDLLLPEGRVFNQSDNKGNKIFYNSDAAAVELPMAVLVNAQSFSAAELFAAQLRESVDAEIVGEETSGKGYAQQLFPLENGGAIGLSTYRYFTGAGESLIGKGLHPEHIVSLSPQQRRLWERKELSLQDDPQYQAALSALRQSAGQKP